jgi:protein-S-isoprenylcysteine O-methyltransferase Ste14
MIGLRWLLPIKEYIFFPYNLPGIIPLLTGMAFSFWGSIKFKQAGTNIKTFNEPDKLVTEGLFRYSRNPMYLGFALALLGVSIITGTVSSIIILVIFVIITDRWYITFEEKMMGKKFGSIYEEYRSETRRWI